MRNNVFLDRDPEIMELEQAGVLESPIINFQGSITFHGPKLLLEGHIAAYEELEKQNPGKWALSQSNRRGLVDAGFATDNSGILVELVKALPIPLAGTALSDILEFKARRRPNYYDFERR